MKISGSGLLAAGAYDEVISVRGSCLIDGNIRCTALSCAGNVKGADITAEEINIAGALHCSGSIKCSSLACAGAITIEKEAEAEDTKIAGKIQCAGLLNSEKIKISLSKGCTSRIGSVGGSEIQVRPEKPVKKRLFGETVRLEVDESVEGDIIELEYTTVPKVTGRVVTVGAGCEIELVQYSEKLEVHEDAKVGRSEKI